MHHGLWVLHKELPASPPPLSASAAAQLGSPQETVESGEFIGALGSAWQIQLHDYAVAMCYNFGVSFHCRSCVIHYMCIKGLRGLVHMALWPLWIQGWRKPPPLPAKTSLLEASKQKTKQAWMHMSIPSLFSPISEQDCKLLYK